MKPAKTKETRCGTCGAEYLVDIGIPHRMGCPDVDNPEAAMPAERMAIAGKVLAEARRVRESEAALRAALKKAEEENELLKWEIQNCRKALDATIVLHSAAKARLSEIVKSLAAAVTKEKP